MDFIAANPLLVVMLLMLPLVFVISARGRKKLQEQQEQYQRQLDEALKPGAWVLTSAGFWGRYVDTEGDVVVLETPDGNETYWQRSAVVKAGESPFTHLVESDEDVIEVEDEPVMGMDSLSEDTSRN